MQPNGAMLSGMDVRKISSAVIAAIAIVVPLVVEMMGLQLNPWVGFLILFLCAIALVVAAVGFFWPSVSRQKPSSVDEQSIIMARSMVTLAREIIEVVGKARLRRNKPSFAGQDEDAQRTQNEFLYYFGSRVEHTRRFLERRGESVAKIAENWSADIESAEMAANFIGASGRQLLLDAGIADS